MLGMPRDIIMGLFKSNVHYSITHKNLNLIVDLIFHNELKLDTTTANCGKEPTMSDRR